MSNQPQRIQRKRTAGFKRPGPFGSPYKVGSRAIDPDTGENVVVTLDNCLELFERYARKVLAINPNWLDPLHGFNLACFCERLSRCHVDIYLKFLSETE
jgi:hypothetical protein